MQPLNTGMGGLSLSGIPRPTLLTLGVGAAGGALLFHIAGGNATTGALVGAIAAPLIAAVILGGLA